MTYFKGMNIMWQKVVHLILRGGEACDLNRGSKEGNKSNFWLMEMQRSKLELDGVYVNVSFGVLLNDCFLYSNKQLPI